MPNDIALIPVHERGGWDEAKQLILEYAAFLKIDLCFQNFEKELQILPELYGLPDGGCLLAAVDGVPVGCVAFKKLSQDTAEMKRLYVRDSFRGLGIGKQLAYAIVECARERGYAFMRLDTIPQLADAVRLYERMGFYAIPPYTYNPSPDTLYMEKKL